LCERMTSPEGDRHDVEAGDRRSGREDGWEWRRGATRPRALECLPDLRRRTITVTCRYGARNCGDVVFDLDVLRLTLRRGDLSDAPINAKAKKQMSLDVEDLW